MAQEKLDRRTLMENYVTSQTTKESYFYASFYTDNVFVDPETEETALAAYEQAIQLAPHEAILHYHKGQVLEQLGRLTEAERAFEDARQLGYNSGRA
jgi:Flp pilus assembly protein TadD